MEGQTQGREVRFASGPVILGGWLQLPPEGVDPWGTVIFLHGAGPQDRDGNAPGAVINLFPALAQDATEMGLAALRYDKRGVGSSSGETLSADVHDLATDLHAAVRFARRVHETAGRPVFLLGHGEGSTLALMEAATHPGDIAGLVLLAPAVRNMEEVLQMQSQAVQTAIDALRPDQRLQMGIPAGYSQLQATAQFIAAVRAAPADTPVLQIMDQTVPVRWFRSHFDLDIAALLPQVTCPVLAVAGAKDAQVPPADAARLTELVRAAGSDEAPREASAVLIPDLTHILRRSSGTGDGSEYAELAQQPLDAELRERIREWLGAHQPHPATPTQ